MKSNCGKTEHYVKELLESKTSNFSNNEIVNHIKNCDDCALIYNQVASTFNEIEIIKDSNPEVSAFFTEKTLSKIILEKENSFSISRWINNVLFQQPQIIVASFIAVIIGIGLGITININTYSNTNISATTEKNITEEAYYAGMSNTYLTTFFENQIPKDDGQE